MKKITRNLIAPCGMNCGVCSAYLRDETEKNHCNGCRNIDSNSPKSCFACRMRTCVERDGKYCFDCNEFPCDRLKHLDKRYRTKYGMSELDNLKFIKENGIDAFVKKENERWQSSKGTYCVHNKRYY